jgi:hypothetical protein
MSWEARSGAWLQSRENQISASAWSIKIIVVSSCCSRHTRSVHVQERIHFEREREREREESDLYSVSMLCFFVKEGKYFPVIKL